jgi:hypothetical protein
MGTLAGVFVRTRSLDQPFSRIEEAAMSEDPVFRYVTVRAIVPEENLSREDENIEGTFGYAFLPSEARALDAARAADGLDASDEHALDLYHDDHAISELENYEISVDHAPSKEALMVMDLTDYHESYGVSDMPRPTGMQPA